MTYKIVTPDGKGYSMEAPEEGKLFKDNSGNIYTLKGGQAYMFNPSEKPAQEASTMLDSLRNQQGIINPYTGKAGQGYTFNYGGKTYTHQYNPTSNSWELVDPSGKKSPSGLPQGSMESYANTMLSALGKAGVVKNQGEALKRGLDELGIDINKIPEYNIGDLGSYGIIKGTPQKISGEEIKSLYNAGNFAGTAGGPKEVFGAEIPKIVSGANGPVDAQGNPIPQSKWAEMGITNQPAQTPTFQTTTGNQGQTNYWKSPSGTIVGAPAGSEAENNFKNLGWTQSTSAEEVAGRPVQNISPMGDIKTTTAINEQEFQRYLKDKGFTDPNVIAQYREQWQTMGAPPGYEGQQAAGQVPTGGGQTGGEAPTGGTTETGVPGVTIPSDTDVIAQNQTSLKDANAIIDNSNLPQSLKDVYKGVLAAYPEGIEYNPTEIINAFNKIKEETVDPYYRQQISLAQEDFNQALSKTKTDRTTELEAERATAGQTIRQAKAGLEKAGKTFTGEAIETLGKESAYAQKPTEGAETVPKQEPFGGLFYEGDIPQSSRLLATSSQARYEANLANLGLAAEAKLGTSGLTALNVPGYKPVGGVTGTLEEEKTGREAATLNDLLEQYRQKRASLQRVEV